MEILCSINLAFKDLCTKNVANKSCRNCDYQWKRITMLGSCVFPDDKTLTKKHVKITPPYDNIRKRKIKILLTAGIHQWIHKKKRQKSVTPAHTWSLWPSMLGKDFTYFMVNNILTVCSLYNIVVFYLFFS